MKRKYYKTEDRRKFFTEMYEKLSGKCMICNQYERLVIDHHHKSGIMRGLLCYSHNAGLGMFQDSPELLEAAARYLREHSPKEEATVTSRRHESWCDIKDLLQDPKFISDRERARQLAKDIKISFSAAQSRIARARRGEAKLKMTRNQCVSPTHHLESTS